MIKKGDKPINGFDKRPQDINLKGRPKKMEAVATLLDEVLSELYEIGENGKNVKREALKLIFKKAVIQAIQGDNAARDFLLDRYLGKPRQILELEGEFGVNPFVEALKSIKNIEEKVVDNKDTNNNPNDKL